MSTNIQLFHFCKTYKIKLNSVISKDLLLSQKKSEEQYFILNLDNKDGAGTHWVALAIKGKTASYFDSFGIAPPLSVIQYCKGKQLMYNSDDIQHIKDDNCGWYCCAFLWYIQQNGINSLNKFLANFSQDENKNEKILNNMIKKISKNNFALP